MNDGQSIEVEEHVGQIGKSFQKPPEFFPAAPTSTPSDSTVANALTSLQHNSDIYPIPSPIRPYKRVGEIRRQIFLMHVICP